MIFRSDKGEKIKFIVYKDNPEKDFVHSFELTPSFEFRVGDTVQFIKDDTPIEAYLADGEEVCTKEVEIRNAEIVRFYIELSTGEFAAECIEKSVENKNAKLI